MNKMNLIYTSFIGNNMAFWDTCINSISEYAKYYNIDFLVNRSLYLGHPKRGVYFISELLKFYDRVLYFEADVFIKDKTVNLFDLYSDSNYVYASNSAINFNAFYDTNIQKIIDRENITWKKTNNHYDIYNFGVTLVSKDQELVFRYDPEDYESFEDLPGIITQVDINYKIQKYKIPIKNMDAKYNNEMYYGKEGSFLHFANMSNRDQLIKEYI